MRNLVIKDGAFNKRIFEVVETFGETGSSFYASRCGYRDRSCSPDCMLCSIDDKNEVRCGRVSEVIGTLVIV